jgi:hypothetical protein
MSSPTTKPTAKPDAPLPKPNGDFYQVTESLNDSERAILQKVLHLWKVRSRQSSTNTG